MSNGRKLQRQSAKNYRTVILTLAATAALTMTNAAFAANDTWNSTKVGGTTDWGTATNWTSGTNVPGDTTWVGVPTTTDVATFGGTGDSKTVAVDANRGIQGLSFTSNGYTIDGSTLYFSSNSSTKVSVSNNITANIDAPVVFTTTSWGSWSSYSAGSGATLNFNNTVTGSPASGIAYLNTGSAGTVNFNGAVNGAIGFRSNSAPASELIYLNAANNFTGGINMEQTRATLVFAHEDAIQSGTANISRGGHFQVTVLNGISGTAALSINADSGGKFVASTLIKADNDYAGNTAVKGTVWEDSPPVTASLTINNGSTSSGSATGTGDVSVQGALLAGDGRIENVDLGTATAQKRGVAITNNGSAQGRLSPGAADGQVGTLSFKLGSKGLDITGAVAGTNTGALIFDLGTTLSGGSDLVNLETGTQLKFGADTLEFDDFVFNPLAGFGVGDYMLFVGNSANAIVGGLGANISGSIGDYIGTLSIFGDNQAILLNVTAVPEPASLGLLALGALGLLARRRKQI